MSTESAIEPPVLRRIRSDMKGAMRSKDSNRLDVLRGLVAAATNESKTDVPVDSDSRVLVLLKKQARSSRASIKEFDGAKRADLKAKEEAQLAILNEYIDSIPTVSDEEVDRAVTQILSNLKANGNRVHYGHVMRGLAGRNGVYFKEPLNMERVHEIVREKLAASKRG